MGVYAAIFEAPFLAASESYFGAEGRRLIVEMEVNCSFLDVLVVAVVVVVLHVYLLLTVADCR